MLSVVAILTPWLYQPEIPALLQLIQEGLHQSIIDTPAGRMYAREITTLTAKVDRSRVQVRKDAYRFERLFEEVTLALSIARSRLGIAEDRLRAETATLATIANTSPPDSVSASRVEQLTLEAESHMAEAWRLEKEARVEEKEASVADLELAPDRNTWMEATAIRAREKRVRAESVFRPRAA